MQDVINCPSCGMNHNFLVTWPSPTKNYEITKCPINHVGLLVGVNSNYVAILGGEPYGLDEIKVEPMSSVLTKAIKEGRVDFEPGLNEMSIVGVRRKRMFEISKTFKFSAAHQLSHLPEDHKCHRLHGHNYTVSIVLRSKSLGSNGFIKDYAYLDIVKKWIDETVDHRNLNEVLGSNYTTAELLAERIYLLFETQIPYLYKVTVCETDNTTASYWEE